MTGQIYDQGYRAFTGERAGVPWAIRSLALHSMRRALGLKRRAQHKIAPGLAIAIAFIPAVVLVGAAAFLGGEIIPDLIAPGDYVGFTGFAQFLFAAAVAPGVLTTDRTNGMLALYLASPLNRTTYVVAKALGVGAVMLIVSVGPILLLTLGYTLAGAGPEGFLGFVEEIVRIGLVGLLSAAFATGIAMFISSIPRRWGIASLAIVATFIVTGVVTTVLAETAGVTRWVTLLSPGAVVEEVSQILLDDRINATERVQQARLPGWALGSLPGGPVVFAALVYVVGGLGATWWRYQRIEVER